MTDFTIIGSGAGGSAAALELLENHYSVEIFEEGKNYNHEKMNMLEGLQTFWRNNGINLFFGEPILNFGEGKAIGGSTIINGGVIADTSEKILKLWDDQINENFFLNDEFRSLIYDLIDAGVIVKKFDRNIIETKISNKTVLITGSLESMSRAEAKVKIEILGAKLSSSLSKKTNFLIAGNKPTLSKLQKAKDLGVRVFSEEEWNDFINE